MKKELMCPLCSGNASLQKREEELPFRKEYFKTLSHFYKCHSCQEEFGTTESDNITITQVYNQYREKHSILFIDEIISIREKYQLPASKMSEVLGLGTNGYSNYEKGEIPAESISNLISMAANPRDFLALVEKKKDFFTPNQLEKLLRTIDFVKESEGNSWIKTCPYNLHENANLYTGFRKPNKEKILNLIVRFINTCKVDFNDRLKLNKLLFYCDYKHYSLFGYSITGISYRAIKYGPVPTFYDNIFSIGENENIICANWNRDFKGQVYELFSTKIDFDENIFGIEELNTADLVINKFCNTPTWDLVELSHAEKAWQDHKTEREVIPYQSNAFMLKAI